MGGENKVPRGGGGGGVAFVLKWPDIHSCGQRQDTWRRRRCEDY